MNPGTQGGRMRTEVGNGCLFMVGAHVAHDCIVGDKVVMVNNATLGGHVVVGENVILGGLSAIHQFVRIGRDAMIGGMSGVENDVIPYGLVMGERAALNGLNLVGLKRRGHSRSAIQALQELYRSLFNGTGTFAERLDSAEAANSGDNLAADVVKFIRADTLRGLLQPKNK